MSGPWEQFQSSGRAIDGGGPWTQFAQPSLRPALEGTVRPDQLPAAEMAKQQFGIDVSLPKEEVRAQIASLPSEKQKKALDLWAEHYVATEHRGGMGAEDVVRTLARGTPIGSWLDEASAATVGVANKLTGGMMGAPYDENLAYYRARDKKFDKENPKTSMALHIGGALASAPLTPALAPFKGAHLLSRIGNGASTGAAYGTLYGAGLGEDTSDRAAKGAEGLALGGGVGAAAVPVAAGLSNAYKYVRDAMRPIPQGAQQFTRGAVDRVSRAMIDGGVAPPHGIVPPPPGTAAHMRQYGQQAQRLGPEGMLADMSSNLTGQAAGLATSPGRGQDIIRNALDARARSAAPRIKADTDAVLGPARDLVQVESALTTGANNRARPLYEAFYGSPVKVSEELYGLLDRAKAAGAYEKAQKLMQIDGFDPKDIFYKGYANKGPDNAALNGRFIDYIKRALDDLAGAAKRAGENESLRRYSTLAKGIRDEVDSVLSPSDPAKSLWAQARSAAGEGLQFKDALEEGRKAFARGTHPDQMRVDLRRMSPVERGAYQEGARGQIRDIMGNAATAAGENGATKARAALGSEFARDKLGMVTKTRNGTYNGGDPQRLINRLDAETRFDGTYNQVVRNSETARRLAAQKEVPNAASRDEMIGDLGRRDWSGMMMQGAAKAVNAMLGGAVNVRNARIGEDMARILVAQGRERDVVAKALMNYQQGKSVTSSQRDALERIMTKLIQAPRQNVIDAVAN